jgi:tRNA A37 N6-isopentenylltransferase MiaA
MERARLRTRQIARRQETWFRSLRGVCRIEVACGAEGDADRLAGFFSGTEGDSG